MTAVALRLHGLSRPGVSSELSHFAYPPPPSSAQPSRFQSRSIETLSVGRLFSFAA